MALQYTVDDIATVPEALRSEYTAKDGKFHLNVDGVVPKERLDEFRSNNIAYRQELDNLKKTYEGVDVDLFKQLTEKEAKLRDKKLIEAGKVDELIEARVAEMRKDHDTKFGSVSNENGTLKKQLEGLLIDSALRDAAAKSGVKATAIDDVLLRGRQVFRLHDGVATAFEGDKPVYGKNSEPLSIGDWVGGLSERASHLFEPNTGGGAGKGVNNGSGTGKIITRAAYDKLGPIEKRDIAIKGDTQITD